MRSCAGGDVTLPFTEVSFWVCDGRSSVTFLLLLLGGVFFIFQETKGQSSAWMPGCPWRRRPRPASVKHTEGRDGTLVLSPHSLCPGETVKAQQAAVPTSQPPSFPDVGAAQSGQLVATAPTPDHPRRPPLAMCRVTSFCFFLTYEGHPAT